MTVTTEPPWLHKTVGVAARNGTNSHTIDFTADGDAPFTPATGSLLIVIVYGGVTHAASGWSEQLFPVSSGELSVFMKTSAPDTNIVVTHNGSNYPVGYCVMEFPTGSTWDTGTSANNAGTDGMPNLTGLTGGAGNERVVVGALGRIAASGTGAASAVWSGYIEDADLYTAFSGTDGMFLTVGHAINVTTTSATPATMTPTFGGVWPVNDRQVVTFAINAAPVSSTTPYTKDYTLYWNVLNNYTKDTTLNWRVLNNYTTDTTLLWRVLNSYVKDTDLQWRVLNNYVKDVTLSWRVLNSFQRDFDLQWRVLNTWSKDVVLQWDVRNFYERDYTLVWNVLSATGYQKDYELRWSVLNGYQKDVDLRWRVLNVFNQDWVLVWNVRNLLVKDYTLLWRVRNDFQRDYVLRWNILSESSGGAWSLWDGAQEIPLTLLGVWDGTQLLQAEPEVHQ